MLQLNALRQCGSGWVVLSVPNGKNDYRRRYGSHYVVIIVIIVVDVIVVIIVGYGSSWPVTLVVTNDHFGDYRSGCYGHHYKKHSDHR